MRRIYAIREKWLIFHLEFYLPVGFKSLPAVNLFICDVCIC